MNEIQSAESKILLGFKFSNKPTVTAHVEFTKKKYSYACAWLIQHLKVAGIPNKGITTIFATMICPVFEYAAPVYHPRLNGQQTEEVKKLQRRSLKLIIYLSLIHI